MDANQGADDEFAEFDLDEAQLDAILERGVPAELVPRPQAAVAMTLGYGAAATTTMTSSGSAPRNRTNATVPVVQGR